MPTMLNILCKQYKYDYACYMHVSLSDLTSFLDAIYVSFPSLYIAERLGSQLMGPARLVQYFLFLIIR